MRLFVALGALVAVVVTAAVVRADDGDTAHGEVDVGFLQDMIDHHEQANQLAAIVLRGDASTPVRNVALDVIASQRYEIGMMEGWLIQWGLERGAPTRQAMTWMGMHTLPSRMPGMATQQQLDVLTRLSGNALDVRFLKLMLDHHRGGLHMSDAAASSARDPHVRWLAGQMARVQRREIREMETLLAK